MHKPVVFLGLFMWFGLAGVSCTTVMYGGPKRSAEEVASLEVASDKVESDTTIAKFDGQEAKGSVFEILPGRHTVEVTGEFRNRPTKSPVYLFPVVPAGLIASAIVGASAGALTYAASAGSNSGPVQSGPIVGCFTAPKGRQYEARATGSNGYWEVEIYDRSTTYRVNRLCQKLDRRK